MISEYVGYDAAAIPKVCVRRKYCDGEGRVKRIGNQRENVAEPQ